MATEPGEDGVTNMHALNASTEPAQSLEHEESDKKLRERPGPQSPKQAPERRPTQRTGIKPNSLTDVVNNVAGKEARPRQRARSSTQRGDRWDGKLYTPLSEALNKVGRAEQLIRNWLPSTGVSFVLAKFGSGKTLLLLDQALCLATDRDWMGYPTARGCFAISLCGEDPEGTLANAEAWCTRHGVDPRDIGTRIVFADLAPNLLDREDCEFLIRHVREKLPKGVRPVVFIDTWQRSTASGGQNEDKDMQQAIRNAELVGKELGGPVIAASHPPKNNAPTIMGSGVIQNSSVAIWNMDQARKSTTARNVEVTRIKGSGLGTKLVVRIEKVEISGKDNYGCPRTGAVLVKDGSISTARKAEPLEGDVAPANAPEALGEHESALLLESADTPKLSFVKLAEALLWQGCYWQAQRQPGQERNAQTRGTRISYPRSGWKLLPYRGRAKIGCKPSEA